VDVALRILLITHPDLATGQNRSESRFVSALVGLEDVVTVYWEDLPQPSVSAACSVSGNSPTDFEVCVFFVRFRFLQAISAVDWSGFGGARILLEHDAWMNYSPGHPQWHGAFPAVYKRDRFDAMFSTGQRTTELLRHDGVNAVWLPKGYSDDVFTDLESPRSGVCTFGTRWPSRRALIAHLRRRGINITDVSGPFESLNDRLNAHAVGVVCNMPGIVPFGRIGRAVNRVVPAYVRSAPAVEPMIKTFETAASGCAPLIDHLDELEDLGFVSGTTCLTYRTFDEAAAILSSTEPSTFKIIGAAAAALARTRHTWTHRALEFRDLLSAM